MTTIYLAGLDVFLPDAGDIGRRKVDICSRYGLTGLFPLDNGTDPTAADASLGIFRANEAMMNAAAAIIANLTPFRGPGADAGTAYELGYMAARGKLCLGYSSDPTLYAGRVAQFSAVRTSQNRLTDAEGLTVENFGLAENLMLIHALELHGCPLLLPRDVPQDIWRDLAPFEACVRLAAERLAATAAG